MVFIIDGYENAKRLCDLYYMSSPELILEELNGKWTSGQGTLLNIRMASSKGAGGEMFFCFSHSSCVLCIFCHKLGFFKSSRMLSPLLPLMRKLTWVEGFDYTCWYNKFSRLLPLLRFHVSSPDITASHTLCISCDT